ncbi:MAG: hypothetical protein A2070_04315 [Bdellovibrionales bacterium GWC1_52_8]|nr:MAG: hypothetical protein A2X97_02310 [Bdellovibrionales bacterium GWA1_52_35]OFZ36122.1 MAG: hypothetical protein A2070_04315 [Bdellovibrionales bacterium GWC1_52_8]HCM40023.1 DUF1343 domain-containing protein [Bdellovibrionales bacterium]
MQLGVDRLIEDGSLKKKLQGQRLALLAHPASMTRSFQHSIDALVQCPELNLVAAFGPQHGMRGDKQDNMIETEDYVDPIHRIPVFSLYGKVRRPTPEMLDTFDTILIDLQDVGCRIYTFLTTLLYILEACAKAGKSVWILDRPNPAGRPIEGSLLLPGWESFVGAGPLPMRHGLTFAEAAKFFVHDKKLDLDLQLVTMRGYEPDLAPGYGWPVNELPWVNPSPNASTLSMARCYSGTVLIEGTHLSEGRGTTRPLETLGAPHLNMAEILRTMKTLAPQWLRGCNLRPCHFEPTFQKHAGKMCSAFQIHVDGPDYDHFQFKPYRLVTLWLKAIRRVHPEYELWRSFAYEYETERLAIDLINGGPALRQWVEQQDSRLEEFDLLLQKDETAWNETRRSFLLY